MWGGYQYKRCDSIMGTARERRIGGAYNEGPDSPLPFNFLLLCYTETKEGRNGFSGCVKGIALSQKPSNRLPSFYC